MSKIKDIFGQFQSDEDREAFMSAQFSAITNLTKQLEEAKAKIRHLEELIKKSPLPTAQSDSVASDKDSDELLICKEQLSRLNDVSKDRELTLEETRKVEIYSKIVNQAKDSSKKAKSPVDSLSTEELLNLVNKNEPTKVDQH
jgi:hypothetical protein